MKGVEVEEERELYCHTFLSSAPYFQLDFMFIVDFSAYKQSIVS